METNTIKQESQTKPKKKPSTAGQSTNLMFSCITLFVICAILIGVGLFLSIVYKAYFGGILLIILGIAFAVINIVLNISLFSRKKVNKTTKKD